MIDPDGCEWHSIGMCSVSTGRTPRAAEQLARRFGRGPDAMPYTTQLNLLGTLGRDRHGAWVVAGHLACSSNCLPVFDPDFEPFARSRAAEFLGPIRNDPFCLGHFLDNELPFPVDAPDRFLALPADDPGRATEEKAGTSARHPAEPDGMERSRPREGFLESLADAHYRHLLARH